MLFTDEFDCQDMTDFVTFIHSQEIADHCIYTEVLKEGYAARVGNLHTYDAVSMDVLRRWVYPLVPDSRLLQRSHNIQYKRHNVYLADEVPHSPFRLLSVSPLFSSLNFVISLILYIYLFSKYLHQDKAPCLHANIFDFFCHDAQCGIRAFRWG